MSEKKYQVIVDGTLVEGVQRDTAKQNIATLFKVDLNKVEPMFSGKPVAIKKGLDAESAKKYMLALKKAGLVSKGVVMGQPSAPAPNPNKALDATLAAVGAELDDTPPPSEPIIDTSSYAMGEAGETLVEAIPIPEPAIDISQYQVNDVGQTLDESAPPIEPDIDISAISMAAAGEEVMDHPEIAEADIDISQLTMADVGEEVMKHEKVPEAKIDTSKLSLDENN